MVPGGQFRHYAPVFHMNIDLAEQRVRQQAALRVVERHASFIAGGFQA